MSLIITVQNFNKLAAIKEIGAALHRINDATLDPAIKRRCLRRNLNNLIDTLPVNKFSALLDRCQLALADGDHLELVAGLSLLDSMIPRTYGMLPAGSAFKYGAIECTFIKRKDGVEWADGTLRPHFNPTARVSEVSA